VSVRPSPRSGADVSRRALFERLGRAERVTQVSAPAGSGKTFLLRWWIGTAGLAESTAWVQVQVQVQSLQAQAWLVIDDVHELRSAEALRQLELLLMRAPPKLRCVLGAHGRTEAVTQARALGLLAPSPMRPEVSGHRDQRT
jgi:LuxR family maltose regulon positive regulatory protein